jgi:hypothetical protein
MRVLVTGAFGFIGTAAGGGWRWRDTTWWR